jgi:hypothetical protein
VSFRIIVLALSLSAAALADEKVNPPRGLPPRFMTVARIDRETIELIEVQPVEGRPDDSAESRRTARLKSLRGSTPGGRS